MIMSAIKYTMIFWSSIVLTSCCKPDLEIQRSDGDFINASGDNKSDFNIIKHRGLGEKKFTILKDEKSGKNETDRVLK